MHQRSSSKTSFLAATAGIATATIACIYFYKRIVKSQYSSLQRNQAKGDSLDNGNDNYNAGRWDIPNAVLPEEAEERITHLFERTASRVKTLSQFSNLLPEERLMLYALYKQSKVGDCQGDNSPSKFHVVEHAKYHAWKKCQGIPKTMAMIKYMDFVRDILSRDDGSDTGETGNGNGKENGDHHHMGMMDMLLPGMEEDHAADIVYDTEDEMDESDIDDEENDHHPKSSEASTSMTLSGLGMRQSMPVSNKENTINDTQGYDDSSSLHEAARLGNAAQIETILNLSSSSSSIKESSLSCKYVNETDETGQSPLHFAADAGNIDCVQLLLKAGANMNAVDNEGIGVLQTAVMGEHCEVVRCLLENGANPDQKDQDGDTPRHYAMDIADIRVLFDNY